MKNESLKQPSDFYFEKDMMYFNTYDCDKELFDGGARFRTLLVNKFGEEFGLDELQLAPYCRVIELLHNATLIHDDVIDNATTRRSSTTLNAKIQNKKSILTGDYMLARAIYELSCFGSRELIKELSVTLKDLVNGELLQMQENEKLRWSESEYFKICHLKTSSIFRWCLKVPLTITDLRPNLSFSQIDKMANELGVIFQILDDIKDFSSYSSKNTRQDLKNQNINFVLIKLSHGQEHYFTKTDDETFERNLQTSLKRSLLFAEMKLHEALDVIRHEMKFYDFADFLESYFSDYIKKLIRGTIYA